MISKKNAPVNIVLTSFLIIILCHNAFALTVTKYVEKNEVNVGDNISIFLTFDNPSGKEIPIQVGSRDIVGGNGFDVQCYDFTLPRNPKVTVQIAKIIPFEPGNYSLGIANITFIDPTTGKQSVIFSNPVNVIVKGDSLPGTTQKITTVYQCNGQSKQSTKTKQTSESQSQQKKEQNQEQNKQQNKQQKSSQQSDEQIQAEKDLMQQKVNNKLQNNQMSQDATALKNEMQKQQKEQEELKKEFEKELSDNEQFQDMKKKLEEQGYKQTSKNIDPKTNNTGDFQYNYDKGSEQAQISGNMQDGKMNSLSKTSTEDEKKFKQMLNNSKDYKKFEQELKAQGFNQSDLTYNTKGNTTNVESLFKNSKNETANISARIFNETVTKVRLEQQKKKNYWYLFILLFILLLSLVLYLYRFYTKKNTKNNNVVEKEQKPFDYFTHSKEMLDKASKYYDEKRYKDAYECASKALRLYFSYKYGSGKEITSTEAIKLLKSKKKPFTNVQKCLNLCGLVEFAKYKPNKKDFDDIVRRAKKEIV